MTTDMHQQQKNSGRRGFAGIVGILKKDALSLGALWNKFNNDWSWNNSAGLAYNLILSMYPMVIAAFAILGIFVGKLDPAGYDRLTQQISALIPAVTSSQNIINLALKQLGQQSGWLSLVAIVLAIFNGSRLFLFLEGCLDIIYHVKPRGIIGQNVMSILMLLLYVVLVPIMVLASSIPALVTSFLQKTSFSQIPGSAILFSLSGIVGGFLASYILFQAIYMVVPNQKISFRRSWLGALVAAFLLELYLVLFPLYVGYFLGSFAAALGLLVLLIFFYYFAMILFIGAEVNAFYLEGVRNTPYDLTTMVHIMTSHQPTSEKEIQEEAAVDHKSERLQEIHAEQEAHAIEQSTSQEVHPTEQPVSQE